MSRGQAGRNWRTKLVVYIGASTTAGAAAGLAVGSVGALVPGDARIAIASAAALIAVVVGAVESTGHPIRPLQCDRETPQRWLHRGALRWAARNGATLGLGASTRLGFVLWYAVPIACLLAARPAFGAVVWGAYGLARATSAAGMILALRRTQHLDSIAEWLFARRPVAQALAGAQLLLLGAAVVVVVGL